MNKQQKLRKIIEHVVRKQLSERINDNTLQKELEDAKDEMVTVQKKIKELTSSVTTARSEPQLKLIKNKLELLKKQFNKAEQRFETATENLFKMAHSMITGEEFDDEF